MGFGTAAAAEATTKICFVNLKLEKIIILNTEGYLNQRKSQLLK